MSKGAIRLVKLALTRIGVPQEGPPGKGTPTPEGGGLGSSFFLGGGGGGGGGAKAF